MKQTSAKGALFIFISALFFGSYGIWSRLMAGTFGEFSQAWIRALLLLAVLIPFGLITKNFRSIEKKDIVWFLIIAICGGLNQAPYYFGFQHLTIGTATLFFYTSLTVGSYIIGKFFFKEKLTVVKYISLALAVIGMYYIYSFSLRGDQIIPAFVTIIAGLMGAAEVVFSKKISDRYSKTMIVTSIFAITLLSNSLLSYVFHEAMPVFSLSIPWMAQFAYTLAMVAAITSVVIGFKHISEPSVGGLIGLFEILFGATFGIIFFAEKLQPSFIVGSVVIIVAMALPDLRVVWKK